MPTQFATQLVQLFFQPAPAPILCALASFLLFMLRCGLSASSSGAATLGLCLFCWGLLRSLLFLLPAPWDDYYELNLPRVPLGYINVGMGLMIPVLEVLCLQATGCAALLCAAVACLEALVWLAM